MRKILFILALLAPSSANAQWLSVVGSRTAPASASDNFTGSVLGANWTISLGNFSVAANHFTGATAGNNFAWWNANSFASDQYSQVTITTVGVSQGIGVWARHQNGAVSGYLLACSSTTCSVYKATANSFVKNGADFSVTLTTGNTIKISAAGASTTTINVIVNGISLGTRTDSSSPWAGGAPGISSAGVSATLGGTWLGGSL